MKIVRCFPRLAAVAGALLLALSPEACICLNWNRFADRMPETESAPSCDPPVPPVVLSSPVVHLWELPVGWPSGCTCSEQPDCWSLYQAAVDGISEDGLRADLRFQKLTLSNDNEPRSYRWVEVQAEPDCADLLGLMLDQGKTSPTSDGSYFEVKDLPIWPDKSAFDNAPPGERRLFILVTDGNDWPDGGFWHTQEPIGFFKAPTSCGLARCPLRAVTLGGVKDEEVRGLAVNPGSFGDDIVLAANVAGPVDVAGDSWVGDQPGDMLVASLGGAGEWSRFASAKGEQDMRDVALGPDARVIVAGKFNEKVDFGGDQAEPIEPDPTIGTTSPDAFVAAFASDGAYLRGLRFGSTTANEVAAVAVTGGGVVAVGGRFNNFKDAPFEVEGLPSIATMDDGSHDDGFILLLNLDLTPQHLVQLGGANTTQAVQAVAAAPLWPSRLPSADVIAAAGYFEQILTLEGAEPLSTQAQRDGFVVALNSEGERLWAYLIGALDNTSMAEVNTAAVRPDGGVVVAGKFSGSIGLRDGFERESAGKNDAFVIELSSAGEVLWSKTFGGAAVETTPLDIALAPDGSVVVVGSVRGPSFLIDCWSLDEHGDSDEQGDSDLWAVKLAPKSGLGLHGGDVLWAIRMGGKGAESASDVAVRRDGRVIIAGTHDLPWKIGDIDVPHSGDKDVFLVELPP